MSPSRSIRPVGAREVQVIDGLFDPGFVHLFAAWIEKLPYLRDDFDVPGKEQYRHFQHDIALALLDSQPLYRRLSDAVTAEVDQRFGAFAPRLTRAYINLVVYGDQHTAHYDAARGVTAIYYANREWADEWHGETLFHADGEAVAAVAPRPGRLCLLPADITHRVGDLSRLCNGARYTVAFKFDTAETVA